MSEFDGDRSECESRLQSPMVFNSQTATATGVDSARSQMRDQVSPLSSFQSSPVAMSNRNRVRAGEKPRTLHNSASSPAVCRGGRGERLRNVGQNMMLSQDFHGHKGKTPFGGGTPNSNYSTFRSTFRDTKSSMGDSCDDWPKFTEPKEKLQQRTPQNKQACSPEASPPRTSSKDRWGQPAASGSASAKVAATTSNSSEDRKLKDELESLKRLHRQELSELELELSQVKAQRDQARQQSRNEARAQEALAEMQEELAQTRSERDQLNADLQLMKEETGPTLACLQEKCDIQDMALMESMEEHELKNAMLDKLQEDLMLAQALLQESAQAWKSNQGKRKHATLPAVQEEEEEDQQFEEEQEAPLSPMAADDYSALVSEVISSAVRPVLQEAVDMTGAELLGMGHYGYTMACKSKSSDAKVVLKFQNVRRVDVAVREWAHGKQVGNHPNIVELQELCMHSDSDQAIQNHIIDSFTSANGTERCQPQWFPNAYICMISEYMDSGAVSTFMEKRLFTLEGGCAVMRQIASALTFMHDKGRNHNAVRPENMLITRAPQGGFLNVKLADVGSAEQSEDHIHDRELLAYTMWCIVVGTDFTHCPPKEARSRAMMELQKSPLLGRRATERGRALIEAVAGLWNERMAMLQVACKAEFEDCEVREPEAAEIRSQLAVCANMEVMGRARASWEKFRHTGHTAELDSLDADQMAALDEEGSITVRDSRD